MATYSATNISTGSVNIRKTASTSAATNGSVAKGATVTLSDYNQRWYSISGGFVAGDFFQLNTAGLGTKTTANFTGTVNVRQEANSSATVAFTLGLGASVTTISTSGTWTKITCSKGTGWIMTSYLGASSGGTNPGGGSTPGVTMYVYNIATNETVNLRQSPNSGASVLTRVGYGKAVSNASPSSTSGWHNATFSGYTGYIMSDYLTTDPNLSSGGGSSGNTAAYLASVKQQITAYSNANRGKAGFVNWNTYRTNLESYAAQQSIGYVGSGSSKNADGTYATMCCASYPYVCRGNGGKGASTQYNSYAATSTLKGKISDLGGLSNLVPGMEVFQGNATTKEHMGVYAGFFQFDPAVGYEPAVFQSTSLRPNPSSIRVRYNDADRQGPNLTSMHSGWEYWIWPMYVVE